MLCDNQGAITLSEDDKSHLCHADKANQPAISFYYEAVEEEEIIVKYAPMAENMSDIFTKALQKPKYKFLLRSWG